jgi:hypothetical protein
MRPAHVTAFVLTWNVRAMTSPAPESVNTR